MYHFITAVAPHLPTLLSSQATNASRIMFTAGKRAQLISTEVPLVAKITKGQLCRGGSKVSANCSIFTLLDYTDTSHPSFL